MSKKKHRGLKIERVHDAKPEDNLAAVELGVFLPDQVWIDESLNDKYPGDLFWAYGAVRIFTFFNSKLENTKRWYTASCFLNRGVGPISEVWKYINLITSVPNARDSMYSQERPEREAELKSMLDKKDEDWGLVIYWLHPQKEMHDLFIYPQEEVQKKYDRFEVDPRYVNREHWLETFVRYNT